MFKYMLTQRPAGIGCQPSEGLLMIEDKDKRKDGCYAVLTYTRKLSQEEMNKYEIKEINHKNIMGSNFYNQF